MQKFNRAIQSDIAKAVTEKADAAKEGAQEAAARAAQTTLESADKLKDALQDPRNLAKAARQATARSSTNAAAKSRELAFSLHGVAQAILAGGAPLADK